MKKAGIMLLFVGLLITVFTGFDFFTREKVLDLGKIEIKADKKHSLEWSPILGVITMVAGAGLYLFGAKKQ